MKNINKFIRFLRISWRPIMIFTTIGILFLYFVVGFFLSLFKIFTPELPDGFWTLIGIFAGSYTVGRSAEKIISTFKDIKEEFDENDLG